MQKINHIVLGIEDVNKHLFMQEIGFNQINNVGLEATFRFSISDTLAMELKKIDGENANYNLMSSFEFYSNKQEDESVCAPTFILGEMSEDKDSEEIYHTLYYDNADFASIVFNKDLILFLETYIKVIFYKRLGCQISVDYDFIECDGPYKQRSCMFFDNFKYLYETDFGNINMGSIVFPTREEMKLCN